MIIIHGICDYFNNLFASCRNYNFQDGIFPIEYDGGDIVEHPLYNAEWSLPLNEFKIKALYVDLSYSADKSWILLLESNDFNYIFKYIDGNYSIISNNKSKIPLELTSNLVSMFERMINLGYSWKPQSLNEKLLNIIIDNI